MKYLVSLAAILAMCSGFTFSPVTPVTPVTHGPRLVIDTSASNFGAVPNSGYAVRTFLLRNTGDAMLHITQVRPTCGCTVASLADTLVAPGQSTKLELRLSADHRPIGPFAKVVFITSNSRDGSNQWLKFYGHFVKASAASAQK
ncbi:MAG TPA: DUF1573 domain-containing protein [Candidatus Kapabacteria bacterium]|nr:DUF1573 domain-containing protein [Candidatus Kapabacteria bacterium]